MNEHNLKDSTYVKSMFPNQEYLLKQAKKNFNNWNEVADFLEVSRAMLFNYSSDRSKLPLLVFRKLLDLLRIKESEISFELFQPINAQNKSINLPFNAELAEIIGVMLGDGSLYKEKHRNRYHTTICFNKAENKYLNYIKTIFEEYLKYKFYKINGVDENFLRNASYQVGSHLIKAGLISGNKIDNKVKIPDWILHNNFYLKRVIRGLFDTDGCVYKKYDKYAQITFKFGCWDTTNSVRKAIIALNYSPTKIEKGFNKLHKKDFYKLYLCKQREIDQFFREIEPKNPKHLERYNNIRMGLQGFEP